MSVKHVKDYYLKVTDDFHRMKETLDELERCITEETATAAIKNIDIIRQQVNALKENYMRISYIVYLLNMPNKKEKQKRYIKEKQSRIKQIPDKDTFDGVLHENKEILDMLSKQMKN